MKVALFSDVHGRLRVVLHLIRNWQMAHRTYLDGALIAGDLGCFPDPSKFDKATKRWIEKDSEEAGFSLFFTHPQDIVASLFKQECGEFSDVRCPIFFIPGNHEDYDFIQARQQSSSQGDAFPVDCYQRFQCIQDGAIVSLQGQDGVRLRVTGLWGIENTVPQAAYRIKPAFARQIELRGENQFDLLLTHDASAESYPKGGSQMIARIIRACKPNIHLFGHVHPINGQHEFSTPQLATKSFILKDVSFGRNLEENLSGALGLLEWDGVVSKVSLVMDDWLKQMRHGNWEQILPEVASEM